MDALLAVIRPKHRQSENHDFRPRNFDILLVEHATERAKPIKQLPRLAIPAEEEPVDYMLRSVFHMTGAERGGLNGRRGVYVPPARNEPGDQAARESYTNGSLFCVPVDSKERLPSLDSGNGSPRFYSLDAVLDSHNVPVVYSKQTKFMLRRLESWLREQHALTPGFIEALFRAPVDYRVKTVVTNPAFVPLARDLSGYAINEAGAESQDVQQAANEAFAKMMAIEKSDMVVINPLYGAGLPYKNKTIRLRQVTKCEKSQEPMPMANAYSVNRYWCSPQAPDYSKLELPTGRGTLTNVSMTESWIEDYPLHKCAYEGDTAEMANLLRQDKSLVLQRDRDSWTPIHYATWYGHLEAVKLLLYEGDCPPNLHTATGSTPLHFAALCGHVNLVECLLAHKQLDVKCKDDEGKMAVDLCEHVRKPDWQAAAKLLRKAMERPSPKMQIQLMDGSCRTLSLVSGMSTTVYELNQQLNRELDLPEACQRVFTVWICSRYLQLQLKYEHKPMQHVHDWKRKIVGMLTDFDPQKEDPKLFWKRDARLTVAEEREIRHTQTLHLLFHETYQNYIKSLYPCAEEDAVNLGTLLLQLNHGDYDPKKMKSFFANEKNLQTLIPASKLKNAKINWPQKLQARYKQASTRMKDKVADDLKFRFLTLCWNLTVYGSAFFTGYVTVKSAKAPVAVYIGVNDIGLHIIHGHTKAMLQSFNYADVDWHCDTEWSTLQVRLKAQPRSGVSLRTKQSGLIFHLMTKLAQINGHVSRASQSGTTKTI